jgi:hypothetical protein
LASLASSSAATPAFSAATFSAASVTAASFSAAAASAAASASTLAFSFSTSASESVMIPAYGLVLTGASSLSGAASKIPKPRAKSPTAESLIASPTGF